jgi:hypothetical protein
MPNRPDASWTPLDAAAKLLGISPDATRKRLERGTLKGEKRDGRWLVDLASADASPDGAGTPLSGQQDAAPDSVRELIDQLKSENAFLRDQLDQRSRELADERKRSDVLHREAFARIEALTTGLVDRDQDDETAPGSPQERQDGLSETIEASPTNESNGGAPGEQKSGFARWWAWIVGR